MYEWVRPTCCDFYTLNCHVICVPNSSVMAQFVSYLAILLGHLLEPNVFEEVKYNQK